MPITITLEGEDEAKISELVDRAVFPSALAAVQGAVRLLHQDVARFDQTPSDRDAEADAASS